LGRGPTAPGHTQEQGRRSTADADPVLGRRMRQAQTTREKARMASPMRAGTKETTNPSAITLDETSDAARMALNAT
jgi:hypothetical protein